MVPIFPACLIRFARTPLGTYSAWHTAPLVRRLPSDTRFRRASFRNVIQGSSPLIRAYRHIRLTHHCNDAFMDNLLVAYSFLDGKQQSLGLPGADFAKLLAMLCHDFPHDIATPLLKNLRRKSEDVVAFAEFSAGVKSCMLFEDLLEDADTLYRTAATRSVRRDGVTASGPTVGGAESGGGGGGEGNKGGDVGGLDAALCVSAADLIAELEAANDDASSALAYVPAVVARLNELQRTSRGVRRGMCSFQDFAVPLFQEIAPSIFPEPLGGRNSK